LYTALPMTLARDGKLSYVARSVAMFVWSHEETIQQSAASVADALGMNRKTVGAALAELQEHGWLVREIHETIGPSGKARVAWERWHLQMTNRPFTADEVRELSAGGDRHTDTRGHQTDTPVDSGRVRETDTPESDVAVTRTRGCPPDGHGGAYQTDTIGMHSRSALEVHDSSNATKGDEVTRSYTDPFAGSPTGLLSFPEEPEHKSSGDDGEDDDHAKGWLSPLEWEELSDRNAREVSRDRSPERAERSVVGSPKGCLLPPARPRV
jgi:hypothetical protein